MGLIARLLLIHIAFRTAFCFLGEKPALTIPNNPPQPQTVCPRLNNPHLTCPLPTCTTPTARPCDCHLCVWGLLPPRWRLPPWAAHDCLWPWHPACGCFTAGATFECLATHHQVAGCTTVHPAAPILYPPTVATLPTLRARVHHPSRYCSQANAGTTKLEFPETYVLS